MERSFRYEKIFISFIYVCFVISSYAFGHGGFLNGQRATVYNHHTSPRNDFEVFLAGTVNSTINDNPGFTDYTHRNDTPEKRQWDVFGHKVQAGDWPDYFEEDNPYWRWLNPGVLILGRDKPDTRFWRRAFLFPNGDVLAIYEGLGIIKLDSRSRLLWARPYPVHHDLHIEPNGTIYVLTREAHLVPRVSNRAPILEDFVSILDPDGVERERVSLLEVFENSADEHSWIDASRSFWDKERTRGLASDPGDIFHTNSIEVLDGRIETRVPAFRAGNLLLSMCHLDTIAVVDLAQRRVVWSMKGFALQHDPKLTSDGELMVFDNAWNPGRSSVTVLDPATRESVWRYDGSADRPFYSRTCGAAERLPNGNTLITESDGGRAFEVTPEREIVWEFYNPQRAGDDDEYIATLFELVRLPSDFPIAWIADRRRDR